MRDYSGLLPEFRPGGTRDPRWMDGTRNLLVSCKSVAPEIVQDLFDYYDGAKLKLATLNELADAWDAQSMTETLAPRREALRECADALRMLIGSSMGLLMKDGRS